MLRKQVAAAERQFAEREQDFHAAAAERDALLRGQEHLEAFRDNRLEELQRNMVEAIEGSELRAEIASEKAARSVLEVQTLQDKMLDSEAAVEREKQITIEATEAQAAVEADLRTLEENSRVVLNDCRALQGKVRELEIERAAFNDVQASFDEERQALHTRIRKLEEQRSDLEALRQHMVDENHNLSRQHSAMMLDKDEQVLQEMSTMRRQGEPCGRSLHKLKLP